MPYRPPRALAPRSIVATMMWLLVSALLIWMGAMP
jgi:hypothetical protein